MRDALRGIGLITVASRALGSLRRIGWTSPLPPWPHRHYMLPIADRDDELDAMVDMLE